MFLNTTGQRHIKPDVGSVPVWSGDYSLRMTVYYQRIAKLISSCVRNFEYATMNFTYFMLFVQTVRVCLVLPWGGRYVQETVCNSCLLGDTGTMDFNSDINRLNVT